MLTPARKRTFRLLTNPFTLAAIPTIALFIFIPVLHQKYILDLKISTKVPENYFYSYFDLDGDGNSEKINAFDFSNGSGVTISRNEIILHQWNISGTFGLLQGSTIHIPADCNGDGIMELYLFSLQGDSILLHSIRDPSDPQLAISNRLIDVAGHGPAAPDPRIVEAEPQDLDGDGRNELLFGIASGFSKHPRKIYAYYPDLDSLVTSPPIGGFILEIEQEDIDQDGIREIIPHGYATGNIDPGEMKHHDYSAWLSVLDSDLKFKFEPVEFRGNLVIATPMIVNSSDGDVNELLVYSQEQDSLASLVTFSGTGVITDRKTIPVRPYAALMTTDRRKDPLYAFAERERGIVLFNHKKEFVGEIVYPGTTMVFQKDIDLDGTPEIIVFSYDTGTIAVYRNGFRHPATARFGREYGGKMYMSVRKRGNEPPQLFFQVGTSHLYFEYHRNPLYYASFGIYPAVYSAFFAFVLLIQITQRRIINKKEEEKRKISELQLALIGNQLDPHFTLNALNSVLYLVEQSEKEKVRDSLLQFAGLYREMLLSAGKSRRTLGEELQFCIEYLELEKMRFADRFNYSIEIPPEINKELPVPRFMIQLFAENSIKHGIASMDEGGSLEIKVRGANHDLTIEVMDNGIGRSRAAAEQTGSTGKGMKLMNELFDLCNKHFYDNHSFNVTDLTDNEGLPAGTLITVIVRYMNDAVVIT